MASKNDRPEKEELSELHKLMGITPEQVRRELIEQGIDPEAEVEAMRRLGRVLAAKFAPQIEREAAMGHQLSMPLPYFEEAVAAGSPAWAAGQDAPGKASILDVMGRGSAQDTILARVSGWSMRDAGINDGDVVLVNTKLEAKDGDIVLADLAGQGQVIKRLCKRRGKVSLESANPDFAPIPVDDVASLRVHGVVVGRAGAL